ncbi:hypothetical protein PIB30_027434 [Stylosanthes scabra]|uniref:Uncharacterized protein n=1 Tax=Stylosanthes scabra TaxID=79078 RepID=A0ABU6X876_9FABA|nr:hypothetical protein [Stylosanthes scabra]
MGVLGCSMVRRKSRASIELGVQTKNKDLRVDSGNSRIDSSRSSGKYNRWLSGASTGPVEIGYYNRPEFSGTGSSLESWRSFPEEFKGLVSPKKIESSAESYGELGRLFV